MFYGKAACYFGVGATRFVGLNGVCKSERVSAGEAHFFYEVI
jgi:hypothetical protein